MDGEFTEVRGTAHDLQAWHELLIGDAAPFQRIEAAREASGFTGRFWRVARNLIDLFGTALYETVSGEAMSGSVPLFLQVTDHISRHLCEPGLETAAVARALAC